VTQDTPIGPDVDLDDDDIRLADGSRLTEATAGRIVEQTRRAAAGKTRTPPPGAREPAPESSDLLPLAEVLAAVADQVRRDLRELRRELRELRPLERLAAWLERAARAMRSHNKVG
jgi:hypothetical protein